MDIATMEQRLKGRTIMWTPTEPSTGLIGGGLTVTSVEQSTMDGCVWVNGQGNEWMVWPVDLVVDLANNKTHTTQFFRYSLKTPSTTRDVRHVRKHLNKTF